MRPPRQSSRALDAEAGRPYEVRQDLAEVSGRTSDGGRVEQGCSPAPPSTKGEGPAAWFDFFLTEPYQRFAITDRDDVETAVLLLVVGLVVSQLAVRARRLQTTVITDAADLSSLQGTARLAEDSRSPQTAACGCTDRAGSRSTPTGRTVRPSCG
ncbi:DUF4118 domain-containing protein [Streptomyces sp. NPDC085524]|uniref:DUF4118 domain-containing protein n=1 Tax=Streptomyces sp. NPDC085524 TaxID=3365728 RepID=UPI0037D0E6DB